MVPGVTISVQGRRGQSAILVGNVPVRLTLSTGSMANRAVGGKEPLSRLEILTHRGRTGRKQGSRRGEREQDDGLCTSPIDRP